MEVFIIWIINLVIFYFVVKAAARAALDDFKVTLVHELVQKKEFSTQYSARSILEIIKKELQDEINDA
ncbi:MAG: hypothetical protein SCK29_05765 [Bacillota bacterium]|nr:hypothetical protein [Bacillota bacterium]MDW7683612.1 hypothetical protein [Bacillota bacterium]